MVFVYLFSYTELKQVKALSQLFRHYHQHQQANPSINFLHFLAMHYVGDDGNPYDNDEDAKLPFKNPQTISGYTFNIVAPDFTTFHLDMNIPGTIVFFHETKFTQSVHLKAIFHPPIPSIS